MSKKITMRASELQGTDVNLVSLVGKGANRIPFKIMKEDNQMIDLASLGKKLFKSAPIAPAIAAVMVAATADIAIVKSHLVEAGLNVDNEKNEGDFVVFTQDLDAKPTEDMTIMKLDNDVALVITGIQKHFASYDFSSSVFNEVLTVEGFYPSVYMAKSILSQTIDNIMGQSGTAAEAREGIAKAVGDFSSYIMAITSAIPERAFKADNAYKNAAATLETKKAVTTTATQVLDNKTVTTDVKPEVTEDKVEKTEETTGKDAKEETTEETKPDTQEAVSTDLAAVLNALSTFKTEVGAEIAKVTTTIKEVADTQATLTARMAKAEEAVNGTVHITPSADKKVTTMKEDAGPSLGLIDTAYGHS